MSTKQGPTRHKSSVNPIAQAKKQHPVRFRIYGLMAATRIKISVVLYNLSKKIGGWWDDSDLYGDDYDKIKETRTE